MQLRRKYADQLKQMYDQRITSLSGNKRQTHAVRLFVWVM